MKWDDLQFIFAVAECGSLSAAGRRLGVNHATVLRRIAAFEKANGFALFERKSTGYALTPDSKDLLSTLRSIENSVSGLERSLSIIGSPFAGRVRVTSTDTICQFILPPHVKLLNDRHPELEIELLSTNTRLDLAQLDAEITIRPTQALEKDLIGERICDLNFRIYGSRDYLDIHQSHSVAAHRWLGVAKPTSSSPVGQWEAENIAKYVVFRSDSFATLCAAAEQGLGLTMLPGFIGDASDKLVGSEQFPQVLTTGVWLACHQDLAGSARIQSLLSYFSQALHGERHRFS